jgi:hypothetical protein
VIPTLTESERGQLIAHADDVAHSCIEKWGRAAVGDPTYDSTQGWYIEVIGLLDDIQMDTIWVFPNGSRELIS